MTGLAVCLSVEDRSPIAKVGEWRLLWMPTALQLLDSPGAAVRRRSVLALAQACRYRPIIGMSSTDEARLVAAALDALSPYDTAVRRLAAARIFCCARPSQLPVVLPLLVGWMQREDEPDCSAASCMALGLLAKLHHPPLTHYGVATRAVAMMRQADPRVSSAACLLAVIILTQEPGSEERQSFLEQMIQAGLLTLQVLRPLLTHAHVRFSAVTMVAGLHAAIAASPLMDTDAFLRLLLKSMRNASDPLLMSMNHQLTGCLTELIHSAAPVQRPLFLAAGVMPKLLARLDFSHAAGSNQQKSNWNILLALRTMLAWPECSAQPNQLHPFCLQLLQSSVLPQLEGEPSSAALRSAAR